MPVDIDIAKVARLARIRLSDEELATYAEQLGVILEHAARVQELAADHIQPTSHPLPLVNSFRDDVVTPSLARDVVLGQAPDAAGEHFRVPAILDDES